MEERNIQSVHIGKLISAFHSACNPIYIIASLRNAGITFRLDAMGNPVCYINLQQCRCLLQPLQTTGVSVDAEEQGHGGETSHVEDSDVPIWLQILDEEASQFLAEKEG
jgi:hypothetical protein